MKEETNLQKAQKLNKQKLEDLEGKNLTATGRKLKRKIQLQHDILEPLIK